MYVELIDTDSMNKLYLKKKIYNTLQETSGNIQAASFRKSLRNIIFGLWRFLQSGLLVFDAHTLPSARPVKEIILFYFILVIGS